MIVIEIVLIPDRPMPSHHRPLLLFLATTTGGIAIAIAALTSFPIRPRLQVPHQPLRRLQLHDCIFLFPVPFPFRCLLTPILLRQGTQGRRPPRPLHVLRARHVSGAPVVLLVPRHDAHDAKLIRHARRPGHGSI